MHEIELMVGAESRRRPIEDSQRVLLNTSGGSLNTYIFCTPNKHLDTLWMGAKQRKYVIYTHILECI